ncbi:hypothetical protein [Roseiarcus sp.]|uniref:hypothetical protein n=1 Tax=Roseiarcus sp. TaxID=1969460 RepID=UPI003C5E9F4B
MKPGVAMLTRLGPSAVVLAGSFMAAPAPAAADSEFCHGVDFDIKRPLVVSRVTAPARVYFVRGADENASCPSDAPACRRPDYLLSGDLVLMGKTHPPHVCVAFQSPLARKQDWTNGWLPASTLMPVAPSPAPKDSDWTGEWVHPGGSITIAEGGGMLKVDGLQTYPALLNVHTGVLNATVRPAHDMIAFNEDGSTPFDEGTEGDCLVRMQRIGPWLAVEDNGACGGVMVTFTGLYRRK